MNEMSEAMKLIKNMVLEAKSHYNDGWVMKSYKDSLKNIYRYLQEAFPDFTSLTSKKKQKVDLNRKIMIKERETWICSICGKNTYDVDWDYIGSSTNHLGCELKEANNAKEKTR